MTKAEDRTIDKLLAIAGVGCDDEKARKELEATLSCIGARKRASAPHHLALTLPRVAASLTAELARRVAASSTPTPRKASRKRPLAPRVDKPRGRGRPAGALSDGQLRKQAVIDHAVAFWIRFSPRSFSAARAGRACKFVEAFHAAATGQDERVERPFERAAALLTMEAERQAKLRKKAIELGRALDLN